MNKHKQMAKGSKKPQKRQAKRSINKDVPDWASLSVKRTINPSIGGNYPVNLMQSLMNVQLVDYPRAVQVAGAFQHFRIKKITLTVKPVYDSFVAAVGAPGKMNLYYMIDKSGSIPTNVTLEGLKALGAKPRQLDENNRTISWAPSILESSMTAGGGVGVSASSKYKISPWLTTSANVVNPGIFAPSQVDHLGVYWFVEQVPAGAGFQYSCEVEVQFEFKKPLTNIFGNTEAMKSVVAELNDSPDGIVGGGDGI